jgi:hypothetical protein
MRVERSNTPSRPPAQAVPSTPHPAAEPPAPSAAANAPAGAPGQTNPRKRIALTHNQLVPRKRARTGGPAHEPQPQPQPTTGQSPSARVHNLWSQEHNPLVPGHLLERVRRVASPHAAERIKALLIELDTPHRASSDVMHQLDRVVTLDEVRYGRIQDPSPQGLYRAMKREFDCQQLEQALAQDPVFLEQSEPMQKALSSYIRKYFNKDMKYGGFDGTDHTPEIIHEGVQVALKLGVNLCKVGADLLTTPPSDFFVFACQQGSALKDRLFPQNAAQPSTPAQCDAIIMLLAKGMPPVHPLAAVNADDSGPTDTPPPHNMHSVKPTSERFDAEPPPASHSLAQSLCEYKARLSERIGQVKSP